MLLWLILNGVLRQTDNFQVVLFNAVTYFIYADSRKKYKRMNTLHAYNLLNESFFLLHKFTQMLVWFQKGVIQQLCYEVKYGATLLKNSSFIHQLKLFATKVKIGSTFPS